MKKTKLKHRTRKFISFALAVCLLTGMLSLSVSAEAGDDKLPSEDCFGYTYKFQKCQLTKREFRLDK